MFSQLSQKLTSAFNKIRGYDRLTESNIKPVISDIKNALLEADVAYEVTHTFIENVKNKCLGEEVLQQVNTTDYFVKIVHDELVSALGASEESCEINLQCKPPAIILMAGLQGSGKTTTTAKLAKWLKEKKKMHVLMTSVDVYRPAALDQIKQLSSQIGIETTSIDQHQKPLTIVQNAIADAKKKMVDVLIIDTAGRTHIDSDMMNEISVIHQEAKPVETLFVVDSMTGQDACLSAKEFSKTLPLTGVVLTLTESDHRGGAALSEDKLQVAPSNSSVLVRKLQI